MSTKTNTPGTRLSYWIARVLQDAREEANCTTRDVGTSLDVDERTIKRLERGGTMGRDIDRFVAGYAFVLGYDDGRELWQQALHRWQREGAPPQAVIKDGAPDAFARSIRREALRRQQGGAAKSERRRATP